MDVFLVVITAPLWVPLFLFVSIIVRWKMGRPVLYGQVRPGIFERPFTMFKFRTMTNAVDLDGTLLPDEQRLTRIGSLIRSTSLDELPGLWSVLKGDMSLVGPRPLLMEYLPYYSREQARRHGVRPGLTGWAQINGRNAISWEEKFRLDVWYVDNRSTSLDLKIIALSVKSVLVRSGVESSSGPIMPRFRGSPIESPDLSKGRID